MMTNLLSDPTIRRAENSHKKSKIELAHEFNSLPLDALATSPQVAAFLNCSEAKLERDRWAGAGLPYVKNGRSVRYIKTDVLASLRDLVRKSTTDPGRREE